ncbi:MAG: TIGR03435 family protein [Terracidiphilus sp.]
MRALSVLIALPLLVSAAFGQASSGAQPAFDVASVRPSQRAVGPDYNNQFTESRNGIVARNATLKRLIADAYRLQMNQVLGPDWLDRNEYDIEAKSSEDSSREQKAVMLRALLAERFRLTTHSETREMRAYELLIGRSGPKIQPMTAEEKASAHPGFHFHGDLRQFADLLAVQLSIPAAANSNEPVKAGGPPIPVLDKTGLPGIYDFSVDIHPELGTDGSTLWQRALEDQLGLRLENRKGSVEVLVVDSASKMPTEN